MSSPLPNFNRYITDSDPEGNSFFSTELPANVPIAGDLDGTTLRLCYTADRAPDNLTNLADVRKYQNALQEQPMLVKPGGGTNFWCVDTAPKAESALHRTITVDFACVIRGEMELILSKDGEARTLRSGDMVVQRSSMHKWKNPSDTEWARTIFVMSECQPPLMGDGTKMEPCVPGGFDNVFKDA